MDDQLIEDARSYAWDLVCGEVPRSLHVFLEEHQAWLYPLLGQSEFLTHVFCQQPKALIHRIQDEQNISPLQDKAYPIMLAKVLSDVSSFDEFCRRIRRFRQRELWILAMHDLLGNIPVEQMFIALSSLADALIVASLDFVYCENYRLYGLPEKATAQTCPLCVIALGKLGADELNFSSDIDLIFCYPHEGNTQDPRKSISHQEFFNRLGRQLIQVLDEATQDGFVYRVDMRLRPFGHDGPLTMSFAALEDYYQQHGRYWERFALIKQRVLGGSDIIRAELDTILQPFVYRRYIDYGVIHALQDLKGQIIAEVRRRHLEDNIKLGRGGIREIEFIVQALQLIQGGRIVGLQTSSLLDALHVIQREKMLDAGVVQSLRTDYLWLRSLENRLQMIGDQQTHTLPDQPRDQQRIVVAFGEKSWQRILEKQQEISNRVHEIFLHIIGPPLESKQGLPDWWLLGYAQFIEDETGIWQKQCDWRPSSHLLQVLLSVSLNLYAINLQPRGTRARDKLLPLVFYENCVIYNGNIETIKRLEFILRAIMGRTPYLDLLIHNPGARKQLIKLSASHQLLAEQLSEYPILLDELLAPNQLYTPIPTQGYQNELQQFMLRLQPDDLEQHLEALRQFKQIQLLRIAAAETVSNLPVMKVSDYLSWVAEALINAVVTIAFQQLTQTYGRPSDLPENHIGLLIMGYGKLGGCELGYLSDLDLVFLRDESITEMTSGAVSIDAEQFYHRLTQKILHLMNTRMMTGVLYQVDVRLRPDGDSGLLCPTIHAWENYLKTKAWTWELQALVRARCVYGAENLCKRVIRIRKKILSHPYLEKNIQFDIETMREKIRSAHPKTAQDCFDLKHSQGGLVDIEFFAQKLVLVFSQFELELTQWTDVVRIFDTATLIGILPLPVCKFLKKSYLLLRDKLHACGLEHQSGIVLKTELPISTEDIYAQCTVDVLTLDQVCDHNTRSLRDA